jgi:hypothetical protein
LQGEARTCRNGSREVRVLLLADAVSHEKLMT